MRLNQEDIAMQTTDRQKRDTITRGEAIYKTQRRATLDTPENNNKILVNDVERSDYEIAEDHLTASNCLRSRRPHSKRFVMRFGYASVYKTGVYKIEGFKLP